MSFRYQYNILSLQVISKYNELKKKGISFVDKALGDFHPKDQEDIRAIIASKDLRDLSDFDFQEYLPKVFYNNKRGEEKLGYALSISEDKGILLFDDEDYTKVFYIGFNDINGLRNQIELLEFID